MLGFFADHFNYMAVVILMMTGLYIVIASGNLIKKMMGLSVFQTSVFLLYISIGKVKGGVPPILDSLALEEKGHMSVNAHSVQSESLTGGGAHSETIAEKGHDMMVRTYETLMQNDALHTKANDIIYSNPLPHVLILTAIVVGVATLAVGLALVVRIREVYGSIEEVDIDRADYAEQTGRK